MISLQIIAAALAFDHCSDPLVRIVVPSPNDADDFSETVLAAALLEHGASPLLIDPLRDVLRAELAKAVA